MRDGSGYCAKHASLASGWMPDRVRGTPAQRGYGPEWQRKRLVVLERDGWLCRCEDCKKRGILKPADQVDHIINKAAGGTDDLDNLRAISRECHKRKTSREGGRKSLRHPGPIPRSPSKFARG